MILLGGQARPPPDYGGRSKRQGGLARERPDQRPRPRYLSALRGDVRGVAAGRQKIRKVGDDGASRPRVAVADGRDVRPLLDRESRGSDVAHVASERDDTRGAGQIRGGERARSGPADIESLAEQA